MSSENCVQDCDLKSLISFTIPAYAMQPFRMHARTPYLKNKTCHLEQWDNPVLGEGCGESAAEREDKCEGVVFGLVFIHS